MKNQATIPLLLAALGAAPVFAAIEPGDLALGLSRPWPFDSLQIVRGQPTGTLVPDAYDAASIQSVEFDNLDGSHSPTGNLLAVSFGTPGGSGVIHWFPTGTLAGGGILIGDTIGFGGDGLEPSRLAGLSVAPDNARVAVSGFDGGRVYIYNHAPGDGVAVPSALSSGKQTAPGVSPTLNTFGTTWYDNSSVLAFGADGTLRRVDAGTFEVADLASVAGLTFSTDGNNAAFTDVEYNPLISPYVFALHGRFDGAITRNRLIAFDPATWAVAGQWPLLGLLATREIALGPDGALYIGQFGGASVSGSVRIARLANASTLQIGDPSLYYASAFGFPAPLSGLDIALPEPGTLGGLAFALLAAAAHRPRKP
jgi:hypothetical protein